ncbi:MAG: EFR1 family ferrodoxin [Bacteroidales bacterium]|nr:EFR1 family ferrodoxin [Bacteroidales bacterium]
MYKISLKYFTGTGNSLRVLSTCKNVFEKNNISVEISSITEEQEISSDSDLVGFCFPVYAFGLPRICMKYLNNLPEQTISKKVFLLVTNGDPDEVGFALQGGVKILKKKNYNVVYSESVHMPSNWITFINPPTKEEAQLINNNGLNKAGQIAQNIIEKKEYHLPFNIPKKYNRFQLYKEYYLFHKLGIYNMWKMFRTNRDCNSCGLCAKVCSTQSIVMVDGKPKWKSSCEQCMRCVNFCKQQAIFQTYGGNTEGKNRYVEPDFKPLVNSH